MAQNPLIKRYLDAGMAFTEMTQARAEAIVQDLVKAGEVQAAKTEELVNQILERSKKNTEWLIGMVRTEVRDQIASLGLATKRDVARVEEKVSDAPAKRSTAKKATKSRKAAKKSGAKKSGAKKSGTKKGAAKKSAARKSGAKKSGAKKATGSKKAAKKAAGS